MWGISLKDMPKSKELGMDNGDLLIRMVHMDGFQKIRSEEWRQ